MCNACVMEKPVFDSTKIIKENAMLRVRPELFYEWDFEKNDKLGFNIYEMTKGSEKNAWWICEKCNSSFDSKIITRSYGSNCRYCAGQDVNHTNSLTSLNPQLAKEWHITKNGDKVPDMFTVNSGKKVWWICSSCKSDYDARITDRSHGKGCPYCSGKKVNSTNSLASLRPDLASEWHPTLNKKLSPHKLTCNSHKRVWWLGKCGHEWDSMISDRHTGDRGCPICSGHRVLKGFNDIWTTNPELASLLANHDDGYKYSVGSGQRVDWKCPDCCEIIKNKVIKNIANRGITCLRCSDGVPLPEKIMYLTLKQLGIDFIHDTALNWSKNKRYDFYLKDFNLIIETHGEQHYREINRDGARTLKEEQENDKFKHELAMQNGIDKYIVIDCRNSEIEWIRNNILNSKLSNLFDFSGINWEKIKKDSSHSILFEACHLWNGGVKNINDICELINLSYSTIRGFLKRGYEIGICSYNASDELKSNWFKKRPIIKLDLKGNIIENYDSITEASKNLSEKSLVQITKYPFNISRKSNSFIFVYENEYIEFKGELFEAIRTYQLNNNIYQLDTSYNLLSIYDNISEASRLNSFNSSNLYAACNGRLKDAYKYIWMYKKDYENYIKQNNKESQG